MRIRSLFYSTLSAALLIVSAVSQAQITEISGNWDLEAFLEGTDFGPYAIETNADASVTETITHTLEGGSQTFTVNQRGKVTVTGGNQFIYTGTGTASTGTNPTYRVTSTVAATGVIAPASNIIAGLWVENQTYTKGVSTVDVLSATPEPFVLIKEGQEPETPGELLEGDWNIEINGETITFDWSGSLALLGNGALIGKLGDSDLPRPDRPTAGIFTVDDEGNVTVSLTTNIEVPTLGNVTVTITGTGHLSEDNTHIEGEWTFTAQLGGSTALAVPTQEPTAVLFSGLFAMDKRQASAASHWEALK